MDSTAEEFSSAHWSCVQSPGLFLWLCCHGFVSKLCWEGSLDAAGISLCLGQSAEHGTARMYKRASSQSKWWQTHPSAFPCSETPSAEVPLSTWSPTPPLVEKIPYVTCLLRSFQRAMKHFVLCTIYWGFFPPEWLAILYLNFFGIELPTRHIPLKGTCQYSPPGWRHIPTTWILVSIFFVWNKLGYFCFLE